MILGAIHKGWFALPASFNVPNCADFRVIPTQTNPEASRNAGRDMTRAGYHLQTCPGESGVHFPSNDTDGKFVVDPDLRSRSEERPDPQTTPGPKGEVVRAREKRKHRGMQEVHAREIAKRDDEIRDEAKKMVKHIVKEQHKLEAKLRRRRRRVKTSEPERIVSRRGGRLHLRGPLRNLDPGEHTAHLLRLLLLRRSLLGNPRLRTLCLELLLHEDQLDELSQCCLVGVCWQGQVVLMLGAEPAGEPPGACGIVTPLPHHLHLLRLERGVGHGLDSELVLAVDPAARVAHEGSEGEDAVVGHALRARHAPLIALLFKHCAQFLLILLVLAGRLVHDASELSPDRDLLPQKAQKKVAGRETSAANRRPSTAGFVRTLEAARGKSSPALEGRDNRHVR